MSHSSAYERDEHISWQVIEDLSCLIDLLCLYDTLSVIGDPDHPPFLTHRTEFFDAMRSSQAIDVQGTDDAEHTALVRMTRRHLRVFLPRLEDEKLDLWLSQGLRLNKMPPNAERVATMNAQIRLDSTLVHLSSAPEKLQRALEKAQDPVGLRPFLIRTFMYLAYAELSELPFAPDSARGRLLESAITREQDLASQLRARLGDQWKRFPTIGAVDLRQRVSPFGAVVLERCKGDRRAISLELLRLRDELRTVRERLGEFEQAILFGKRDGAVQAEQKWNRILHELSLSYGPSPKLVSLASGLRLAESAAEIFDQPQDVSVWFNVFKFPSTVLVRYLRRQPVAQLLKLRAELPAAGRLISAVHRIFPETAQLKLSEPLTRSSGS